MKGKGEREGELGSDLKMLRAESAAKFGLRAGVCSWVFEGKMLEATRKKDRYANEVRLEN